MTQQTILGGSGVYWSAEKVKINDNFTELYTYKRSSQPTALYMTADHTISSAELLANDFFSNYGASAKVHATLPAVSYNIVKTIIVEESQIIEIVPPSGEVMYYQGTALTTDYVIDSPATVGSMAVVTRIKTGASTWSWNVGVAQGTFSNPGRVHD